MVENPHIRITSSRLLHLLFSLDARDIALQACILMPIRINESLFDDHHLVTQDLLLSLYF